MSMADCTCINQKAFALTCLCADCGKAHTVYLTSPKLAEAVTNIRQGKVPLDYALTAGSWTEDERATLEQVTVCGHTERTAFVCTNGEPRERCNGCGRVWNQRKDFILTQA